MESWWSYVPQSTSYQRNSNRIRKNVLRSRKTLLNIARYEKFVKVTLAHIKHSLDHEDYTDHIFCRREIPDHGDSQIRIIHVRFDDRFKWRMFINTVWYYVVQFSVLIKSFTFLIINMTDDWMFKVWKCTAGVFVNILAKVVERKFTDLNQCIPPCPSSSQSLFLNFVMFTY